MSMKFYSDVIGNRTRDPPACSVVPQPTAPPRTPVLESIILKWVFEKVQEDVI